MTGTITRVISEKGFGFLMGDDNVERFFHRSALVDADWPIKEQTKVEFDHQRGQKGPRAVNVRAAG